MDTASPLISIDWTNNRILMESLGSTPRGSMAGVTCALTLDQALQFHIQLTAAIGELELGNQRVRFVDGEESTEFTV